MPKVTSELMYKNLSCCAIGVKNAEILQSKIDSLDSAGVELIEFYIGEKNDTSKALKILLEKFRMKILILNTMNLYDMDDKTFNLENNLELLTAFHLRIGYLRSNSFKNLKNLLGLHLRQSEIHQIDESALRGLSNLISIWLGRMKVKTLPKKLFDDCKSLRIINLSRNQLEVVEPAWFYHLSELTVLYLDMNPITSIPAHTWINNKKLLYIQMADNKIRWISRTNLETFEKCRTLYLKRNECVDEMFLLTPNYIANNRSMANAIRAILFPLCDEKSDDENSGDVWKISVKYLCFFLVSLTVFLMIILIRMKLKVARKIASIGTTSRKVFNFKDLCIEYVDRSTIHGVRYMGEKNNHWTER